MLEIQTIVDLRAKGENFDAAGVKVIEVEHAGLYVGVLSCSDYPNLESLKVYNNRITRLDLIANLDVKISRLFW